MSDYTGKDVTVEVSTKGRYNTTLPLVLTAIANQTVSPAKVLIIDDSDPSVDLRVNALFTYIMQLFSQKSIKWWVIYGQKKGQVWNHQTALHLTETPLIWRLDDDTIPESNVLETLLDYMIEGNGAVGGLVVDPRANIPTPSWASPNIEDLMWSPNFQWGYSDIPRPVDHLYSSFLFRKEAGEHGYCLELSPVCHREETMFTHEMKRKGWNLVMTPYATTWHFRYPEGGIRTYPNPAQWEHDEMIFRRKCAEWGVKMTPHKVFYLYNGLGDHLAFKQVWPQLKEMWKGHKLILAHYWKEVFEDEHDENVVKCGVDEVDYLGIDVRNFDVYGYLDKQHSKGNNLTLAAAFKEMYS